MPTPTLNINHLHLHHAGQKATAMKLGVEHALRQVRLRPGDLPPGAILLIRRLETKRSFSLHPSEINQWQRQVQHDIEELARRALRPGQHHIPPDAQSILFYDAVELLTAYTRDALAWRPMAWYWVDLFPDAANPGCPIGQKLLIAWSAYPQALPQTLVELKPHDAARSLASLNASQMSRLAHLLHQTFALTGEVLHTAVAPSTDQLAATQAPGDQLDAGPPPASEPAQPPPPWREWLPQSLTSTLSPQAEYILGLCYTLVYRPQQARQRPFTRAASQWLAQTLAHHTLPAAQPWPQSPSRIAQPAAIPDPTLQETAVTPTTTSRSDGFVTGLGGAIFLINLLSPHQLPTHFPALSAISPWELLGAITAELLGPRFSHYQNDPLWAAINQLAGLEPDQRWGEALAVPVTDALPPEWSNLTADLAQIEPNAPTYRLRYTFSSDNLGHFVARIRPFLAYFIHALTGESPETLLCQPATLYLSRTHVDLYLALEQTSLPIRRAGLDRTPGWLPAYGTIVTIHFE